MSLNASPITVVHRPQTQCFEALVDGLRCELDYQLRGSVMHIVHTGVPRALEGRGIAAQLVATALVHARAEQWRVVPVCGYVEVYMRRHPETADLRQP
jgi:predicted GNAT family acetyltransferase